MLLARRAGTWSSRWTWCAGRTSMFVVLWFASGAVSPARADGANATDRDESAGAAGPERHDSHGGSTEPDGALPLWVLLPGQEAIAAAMLGGAEGVAGCAFETARVERERIVASFTCTNGHAPFTVVMRHPGVWGCSGECTAKFALSVARGSAPPGFLAALGRRVAAHESRIRWTTPGGRSRISVWFLHYVRRPGPAFGVLAVVAMVLLLVFDRPRRAKG